MFEFKQLEIHDPRNRKTVEPSGFNPSKRIDKNEKPVVYEKGKYDPDNRIVTPAFKDDNGKVFRTEKDLIPNNTFEKNGYIFKTDKLGRPASVKGELKLKPESEKRGTIGPKLSTIGKGFERKTDDRAHIFGDRFKGPGTLGNLIPMDAKLNRGDYNSLEKKLASHLKEGASVYMRVDPKYSSDSFRPDKIVVRYSINGEKFHTVFDNRGKS